MIKESIHHRDVLGIVLPAGWWVVGVGPFLLAWNRLPEPMASHWGLDGAPDAALPRIVMLALHAAAASITGVATFVVTRRAPASPGAIAPTTGLCTFVGVLFAVISATAVVLNLDAVHWRDAGHLPLAWVLGAVTVAAAVAKIVTRWARTLERGVDWSVVEQGASVGLRPNERAMWSGQAANRWLSALAGTLLAGAAVGASTLPFSSWASLAISAVVLIPFSRIRVQVDPRGVTIAYGPIGFPRAHLALEKIAGATRANIAPLSHGGWGYRGSLWLFGRASIVIRGGEALRIDRRDGRTLFVTVDDAETGAGLLNDLIARAKAPARASG